MQKYNFNGPRNRTGTSGDEPNMIHISQTFPIEISPATGSLRLPC